MEGNILRNLIKICIAHIYPTITTRLVLAILEPKTLQVTPPPKKKKKTPPCSCFLYGAIYQLQDMTYSCFFFCSRPRVISILICGYEFLWRLWVSGNQNNLWHANINEVSFSLFLMTKRCMEFVHFKKSA